MTSTQHSDLSYPELLAILRKEFDGQAPFTEETYKAIDARLKELQPHRALLISTYRDTSIVGIAEERLTAKGTLTALPVATTHEAAKLTRELVHVCRKFTEQYSPESAEDVAISAAAMLQVHLVESMLRRTDGDVNPENVAKICRTGPWDISASWVQDNLYPDYRDGK